MRQGDCLSHLKQFRAACGPYRAALRLLRRAPPPLLHPQAEREREAGNKLYSQGQGTMNWSQLGHAPRHDHRCLCFVERLLDGNFLL